MQLDPDLASIQEVRELCEKASQAQKVLAEFSQDRVDTVVAAMAKAGSKASEELARLAVEETRLGVYEDKITKNRFAADNVYASIRDLKTVGFIREIPGKRVFEIAEPMGVVAAITPVTNPTSTVLYKSLISIKARNALVFSPHPRAVKCTAAAARVMLDAAVGAGAPANVIGCQSMPTEEGTAELLRHKRVSVILATGGTGLVRAAYSSGKPAYGVGPGNVPAYIESSANIQKAVADILASKCFDNGTVCSSEQAIITDLGIKEQVVTELKEQGAYFLNAEETQKVQVYAINPRGGMNPEIVGQPAQFIARQAGINVPARTRVLVAELEGVGKQYPLSGEKLSPILAFYIASDWVKACERCIELLTYMGLGHTLVIHSGNEEVIREFALKKPAFRILVNTPGTHGAIGFSTGLEPALTLGCGTWGGSITSDNVTPLHLINIKRLAYEIHPVRDIARVLNGRGAAEIVAEQVKKEEAPRILSDEEVEKVVADFMQWRKGKGRGGV